MFPRNCDFLPIVDCLLGKQNKTVKQTKNPKEVSNQNSLNKHLQEIYIISELFYAHFSMHTHTFAN